MATAINKKTLEHLAGLARLELTEYEEEKLLKDLEHILAYFEELKSLETSGNALTRGTEAENVFHDDENPARLTQGAGTENFPDTHEGYLKIPPVF